MQKDNQGIKGLNFMILGIVMAVVSVLIIFMFFIWDILPGAFFFLLFITIPLVINGIAYFVYNVVVRIKGKDLSNIVLSLICLVIAIISAIIGGISYTNDHSFMMRGLEAEFIWFFVSAPAFVLAIIHFVISYIYMSRKVKNPEQFQKIDFSVITACGECCTGCAKKIAGECPGCIEADGYVPEWAESGRCRIHACVKEHGVHFCGLCKEFPCDRISELMPWNKDIVSHLAYLKDEYEMQNKA